MWKTSQAILKPFFHNIWALRKERVWKNFFFLNYSVFIQEVSQPDYCVVIDPKIKWNQLNNSLFLYSWQKILIYNQICNICDLISNNQTSGRRNTGIAHVCFSWVVFTFMLDNVHYYSSPALLIWYFLVVDFLWPF